MEHPEEVHRLGECAWAGRGAGHRVDAVGCLGPGALCVFTAAWGTDNGKDTDVSGEVTVLSGVGVREGLLRGRLDVGRASTGSVSLGALGRAGFR